MVLLWLCCKINKKNMYTMYQTRGLELSTLTSSYNDQQYNWWITLFFPSKITTLTCYSLQLLHTYIRNLFQKLEKYPLFRFTFHILITPSKCRLRQPNSSSKRLAPMALFGPSPCWIHHLRPEKIWPWACFPFDKMGRGLGKGTSVHVWFLVCYFDLWLVLSVFSLLPYTLSFYV